MKSMKQCAVWLAGLLLASCSGTDRTLEQGTVNVVDAMKDLQELKASQLGKKIRFVPLETNDSALVSRNWNLLVNDKYAIVSNTEYGSSQKCMTFDLNSGKYIATVGHPGQDPEAYGYCVPVLDETDSDVLYFHKGKGLVKYSADNRFLGSIKMGRRISFYPLPLISDTVMSMAVLEQCTDGGTHIAVLRMNLKGERIDSTTVAGAGKTVIPNTPKVYTNASIYEHPSLMPHSGLIFQKIEGMRKDAGHVAEVTGSNQMWQADGAIRFHQAFNDTVYSVDAEGASVAYLFDTGRWHYSADETEKTAITSDHVFVTDVTETKDKVVFAVSKGWFKEDNKEYVGLYDKKTGTTVMGEQEKGFRDDLAGFAPFYPIRTNSKGQLIGVMTVEDIDKWLEKHPETERPAFLDTLTEDANPVLVIVE